MDELQSLFISLIFLNNLVDLYKFMKEREIDPTLPRDEKGGTALHIATLNNSTGLVQFLFRYIKENYGALGDPMIVE